MAKEYAQLDAGRLARLVDISRTLNSTTDSGELLTYIIREAAELTHTEAASIMLLDPHTRQLTFAASSNEIDPKMADTPVPLDRSIAGAVLKENRPLLIPDVAKDPRWNQNVDETIDFQTREILGVPMHNADQRPVGVLEAINKQEGKFSEIDARTLAVLADLAGVAVEKSRLIEELSEVDQLKTDFIAIASHELRTPLAIILGYAEFIREAAPAELTDLLDSVLGAANRLNGLIQQMLNFQYTDADADSLSLARVDVVALVHRVLEDKELPAAAQQTLSIRLSEQPLYATVDPDTMELVFGNLVDNALRFTPEDGRILIALFAEKDEIIFNVADNGIGIPLDQQERIFKRFYQVANHMKRKHGGLGLGLSIAKELVELHHGRIWVESREGKGSRFCVALKQA